MRLIVAVLLLVLAGYLFYTWSTITCYTGWAHTETETTEFKECYIE